MKCIGIDFGNKKTGLALSDEQGSIAMPHTITPTSELYDKLKNILKENVIAKIIIGESVKSDMSHNDIFAEAKKFIENFQITHLLKDEKYKNIEIIYEKEFFSSMHARQEDKKREVDDRAAALILQRYLDRQNIKNRRGKDEILEEYE